MSTIVSRSWMAWIVGPLVMALDAWSRQIARAKAEQRRQKAAAKAAAKAAQPPVPTAQWPATWNE